MRYTIELIGVFPWRVIFTLLHPQRFAERYAIGEYFRGVSWSRAGRWAPTPKLLRPAAEVPCFLL